MLAIIQSKIFCLPASCKKNLKIKTNKTVILPVVLYGYETWSLTLRDEHRLRVFENRVLRIFGPKREEDGSWGKLHNDELHSLYSSPNVYRVLVGRPEGKRPVRRPRRKWYDNIRMDLRELGIDGSNCIWLAQDGSSGGLL
jgi:hypothetical protein